MHGYCNSSIYYFIFFPLSSLLPCQTLSLSPTLQCQEEEEEEEEEKADHHNNPAPLTTTIATQYRQPPP